MVLNESRNWIVERSYSLEIYETICLFPTVSLINAKYRIMCGRSI
jgi:hypothetical protein